MAVVTGAVGTGKTWLLSRLAETARAGGMAVLRARATPAGRETPWRAVVDALTTSSTSLPQDVAQRLDHVRELVARTPSLAAIDDVTEVLAAVGRDRGVVLVLDDLHWADRATVEFVECIAPRLSTLPIALISSVDRAASSAGATSARHLVTDGLATGLVLDRLDPAEVDALVRRALGDDIACALVARIDTLSDGVPLALKALLEAGGDVDAVVVPPVFEEIVRSRLRGLGDDDAVARVLAGLGPSTPPAVIAAAVGDEERAVSRSLRRLRDRGILESRGRAAEAALAFAVPLTGPIVWRDLLPHERVDVAQRSLRALAGRDTNPDPRLLECASRLHCALGDGPAAAGCLVGVASARHRDGDLASAEWLLRQARSLAGDSSIALEVDAALLEVLASAGKLAPAFDIARRLGPLLEGPSPSPALRARVHRGVATAAALTGRPRPARVPAEAARPQLDDPQRSLTPARANVAMTPLELPRFVRGAGPDEELRHARAVAEETMATEALVAVRDAAARAGRVARQAGIDLYLAGLHSLRWALDDATEAVRRSIAVCDEFDLGIAPFARAASARLLLFRGDRAGAAAALASLAPLARADPAIRACLAGDVEAVGHALADDRPAVRTALDAALRAEPVTSVAGELQPRSHLGLHALFAALGGDDGPTASLERSGHRRVAWIDGHAALADAVRLGRAGAAPAADVAAAHAARRLALAPWSLHHGRLMVVHDAASRGWGQPERWLREAIPFFEQAGHRVLAQMAKRALRDLGLPVPRRGRGDAEVPASLSALGVTSREMDVLLRVAEGLTNRAIAERLYLSPRTVKSHVASLLRKTGASNRSALTGVADVRPT